MAINVLWVDDDPAEHEVVQRAVERCADRITLAPCRSGKDALKYARGGLGICPPLDLVLLDLVLPDQHGLEVLTALKKDPATKLLPVIVYSVTQQEDAVREAYHRGASFYVVKPPDFNGVCEFVAILERFCTGFVTLPRAS